MIKKISTILLILVISGCAGLKDKMPTRKACTGEKDTLADVFCKKQTNPKMSFEKKIKDLNINL